MKQNLSVISNEVEFEESRFILTRSDASGVITYANKDFLQISGFIESELVGSNHEMFLHTDMPAQAIADMWKNLKAGKTWVGLVKHLTKNGNFFWAVTNATPVMEGNNLTGYLCVLKKPTIEQVNEASDAYARIKSGLADGLSIVDGKVITLSKMGIIKNSLSNLKVYQRFCAAFAIAVGCMGVQYFFGLNEILESSEKVKTIYQSHLLPLDNLYQVDISIQKSEELSEDAMVEAGKVTGKVKASGISPVVASAYARNIRQNISDIENQWSAFMASQLTPEEKDLANRLGKHKEDLINHGLNSVIAALNAGNIEQLAKAHDAVKEISENILVDLNSLIKLQSKLANDLHKETVKEYENTRILSWVGFALIAIAMLWVGALISRSVTKSLDRSLRAINQIAEGNYNAKIEARGENEMSEILHSLMKMQAVLSVNENALKETAAESLERSAIYESQLEAINKSMGSIEFTPDGTVITANDIFLNILGYTIQEVVGTSHSAFVDHEFIRSGGYKAFWERLNKGESITGEFLRIGKGGKEVWLDATYNPIMDAEGRIHKVVKYATDITEKKLMNADFAGQITAIGKAQGVIEIDLDGIIIKVNKTYADMLGYKEHELVNFHMSKVLDPAFSNSNAYKELWLKLVSGGSEIGQYKRIAKDGSEVWIQASYNPIYDLKGKPYKIVNYTMDITESKLAAADNAGQISGIHKTQGVIEFDLDSTILSANDIFLNISGYTEQEIIGKQHSMFVEPSHRTSIEYKAFWDALRRGEAQVGQVKRVAKNGKVVWMQAIYNPIPDMNGKPFKVVKYATDITDQHNSADILANAVEETKAIIEAAKGGDLSNRVSLEGKSGAISSLCDGVNVLLDKMTEVIVQVREASATINTAAEEISSGNNDLSSRTELQASSLEKTSSRMDALAATVNQNAENAKQANQLAEIASNVAVKGGSVVGEVVTTMNAINQSAKKIEDIISVIDGIAFQTNILALNAAVEAARAGEQGRGFAVVASEVRNLAQRSASAAKEIKTLIANSVSKTAEGSLLVTHAGKTMKEIVDSVQRVTDIMSEISAASVEQSTGIHEVNEAIFSMDESTQQNAALVEQAAAASESLVDQAVNLVQAVSVFKLGKDYMDQSGHKRTVH